MRNRFVLAAYPKGPRRAEIEDLLLMAAADGRARIGVRGTADLMRHGLRARLGRARSAGVVALAMIVSLVAGFLLASAANRLAWEAATDLPDGAARSALSELVAAGRPVQWAPDAEGAPFHVVDGAVRARHLTGVARTTEAGDAGSYLAGLTPRLQAHGWHVLDISPTGLLARDGHLLLRIEDGHDATGREGRLEIRVSRTEPPWITVLTFAAGLLGALLGWLTFGWASRRTEHRTRATTAAGLTAVLGLTLLAPALSLGLIFLNVLTGDYSPDVPFWGGLVPAGTYGGLAVLAGVALGIAVLIAACCRPGRGPQRAAAA
ncbi:hypothetical protein [Actinoplanes sp. NPDC049681]|uniref:hypothetical protein n=1 Tax=Actinoplanes sp. NPDC049681 TaxID=3363905 RepID=UPI00378FC0D3